MHSFRAYVLDLDGHVIRRIDLACEKDDDAIERAKQLVDGYPVELWDGARKIAEFEPPH